MAPHADETQSGQGGQSGQSGQGNGHGDRNVPKPGDYLQFESLPPNGPLNRWSQVLTRDHDFPGAQVRISPSIRGRHALCVPRRAHLRRAAGFPELPAVLCRDQKRLARRSPVALEKLETMG